MRVVYIENVKTKLDGSGPYDDIRKMFNLGDDEIVLIVSKDREKILSALIGPWLFDDLIKNAVIDKLKRS